MSLKKILLLASPTLALLALFAFSELAARRYLASIPESILASGLEHPPYFFAPNVVSRNKLLWAPIRARINSEGLRGPELSPRKGALKRVLLIGDSVIQGMAVQDEETLSVQLQERLNAFSGARQGWEVLNGGVSSYDAWDYEAYLKVKGLAFEPDIVIVGLYMNDHVPRLLSERSPAQRAGDEPPPRTFLVRLKDFLSRSEILRGLMIALERSGRNKFRLFGYRAPLTPQQQARLESFFPGDPGTVEAVKGFLRDYRYPPGVVLAALPALLDVPSWKKIEAPLSGIRKICQERKIKLIVLVLPTQFQVYPGYAWPEPNAAIASILKRLGLSFIDIRRLFALNKGDAYFVERNDIAHPSKEGYALMTEALFHEMKDLGWLR